MYYVLAFCLGIYISNDFWGTAIIAVLLVFCEIVVYLSKKKIVSAVFSNNFFSLLFVSMLFGSLFIKNFNMLREKEVDAYDGKIEYIVGTICDDGIKKNSYYQYTLRDNYIGSKRIKSRILLKSENILEYGTRLKLKTKLSIPGGARNNGAFDYRKYLKTQNVYIVAESQESKIIKNDDIIFIERISHNIRNKVREFTKSNFVEDKAAILNALIIGDDSLIGEEIQENYKKAGMVHLLVVSGGHTAFIILFLKYILLFVKPSKNFSKIIYISVIILYIFITGGTPSILRAGYGIIITMVASLIGRQTDNFTTIFFIILIILLRNPNILFSLSFLLSFGGVFGIILCYSRTEAFLNFLPKIIREPLALTTSAQLFVTPITIYSFNTLYLSGFISNIFTLNIVGVIMGLGFVGFFIYLFLRPLTNFIVKITGFFVTFINKIAELFGNLEVFNIYVITPDIKSIVVYYFLLIYFFLLRKPNKSKDLVSNKDFILPLFFRKNKKTIIAILGSCLVILLNVKFPNLKKSLKISVIDVGHGDSILITTPKNSHVLIDTGDKYYQNGKSFDNGEKVVVPYLLKKGIKNVELLILTHMDSDHIGGMESIVKMLNVEEFGISINSTEKSKYEEIKELSEKYGAKIRYMQRGDRFIIDDVKFNVLMPEKSEEISNENNDSIVLLVEYKGKKALFMGDLEVEGEEKLIDYGENLNVNILKLGHHGSITSSSEEFILATRPEIALISVGNRFKSIPGKQVLARLGSIYSKIYRTDKNGEINIIIDDKSIRAETTY